jgi:hypothetical protein
MPSQTSYFQRDILRAAEQDGSLGELYWFVEAEYPKRLLPQGIKRRQPAQWPMGFVPVLPAGPDVEEQQAWAELLAGLFESGNSGRGIAFKASLTTAELLSGMRWYEYGDQPEYEVDHVCQKCGQVQRGRVGVLIRCECYEW